MLLVILFGSIFLGGLLFLFRIPRIVIIFAVTLYIVFNLMVLLMAGS